MIAMASISIILQSNKTYRQDWATGNHVAITEHGGESKPGQNRAQRRPVGGWEPKGFWTGRDFAKTFTFVKGSEEFETDLLDMKAVLLLLLSC